MENNKNTVFLNFQIPIELRDRARIVAKKMRKTLSEIARDGLREQVDFLNNKLREEKRRRIESDAIAERHIERRPNPLAPSIGPLAPRALVVELRDDPDPVTTICEKHAKGIADVLDVPDERKKRIAAVLAEVQREMPLTCPPDTFIVTTLERIVVRLKKEPPAALVPPVEVIDTSNLKSRGDV